MEISGDEQYQKMHDKFSMAREFLDNAREIQRESGKILSGRIYISEAAREDIALTLACSEMVSGIALDQKDTDALCARFEELCRRRNYDIPADLKEWVHRLLAAELYVNAQLLEAEPEALIPATLYNGALEFVRAEEFAEFAGTPWVFQRAAVSNPSDPEKFLRTVQKRIKELAANPEFAEFAGTTWVFRHAAVSNPSAPEKFLRTVQKKIEELAANPEFAEFAGTTWVFQYAAVNNSSDPEKFLRTVQEKAKELAANPEFAEFADMPGLLRYMAAHNPSDPEKALRKMISGEIAPLAGYENVFRLARERREKAAAGDSREI